jgi:molybdate transport system permease protein
MFFFMLLPLIALILRVPLIQLLEHLTNPYIAHAITLSLVTTFVSMILTLLFGTPVAYLLARYTFRGRMILDTLIDLPMVLPPSVAGIALLVAFGRRGLAGQYLAMFGLEIAFTPLAVVIAQIFVSAPFYIKAAIAGFAAIDRELEQAAALDGAGRIDTFRHITLPLAWTGLFGGAVMTWARALGEFGATIIFAGNLAGRTQTMPLAIYQGFEQDLGIAITLSILLLAVSFAVLFVVRRVLGGHN